MGRPTKNGSIDERSQRIAVTTVRHMQLLSAARDMVVSWRREGKGLYRVHPGAVVALLTAIDQSWDVMEGVK